ncbi:MAG: DUF2723 domain-containing protein [Candidatus Muiribacteriota bacterium]
MDSKKFFVLYFLLITALLSSFLNSYIDKGDGGEFILTGRFLGNAHPSGYPLYNIITRLFHFLPGSIPNKISFASVIFSAFTAFGIFLIIMHVLENFHFAFLSGITYVFGKTIFETSTTQEAYSLFLLFLTYSLYFCLKYISNKELKYLNLCFFSAGLLTSVHITGVFYFLILFICLIDLKKYRQFIFPTFFFLLPLSIYFVMFLRNNAFFSWGDINSFKNIFEHISGAERKVEARFFRMSMTEYFYQLTVFIKHIMTEYNFLWVFSIPGIFFIFKYEKKYFYPVAGIFIFCMIFYTSVARNLAEKGYFFLACFFSLFIFSWFGIFFLHKYLFKDKKPYYLLIFPVFLFFVNQPDYRELSLINTYCDNITSTVAPYKQGVLFIQSDEVTFNMWIRQKVYGQLQNFKLINKDMLNTEWYRKKYGSIEQVIENAENVFFDVKPYDLNNYYIASKGIVYKLEKHFKSPDTSVFENYILEDFTKKTKRIETEAVRKRYAQAYNNIGLEFIKENNYEKALQFFNLSLKINMDLGVLNNREKTIRKEKPFNDEIDKLIDFKYFDKAEEKLLEQEDWERLAEVYWNTGKIDRLQSLENIPELYKGFLMFNNKEYEQASKILIQYGYNEQALIFLALSQHALGKRENAIKILEEILAANPNNQRAYDILLNLKGYVSIK